MFANMMNNNERRSRQSLEGVYINTPCPECAFAFLTQGGFRVMVHTMAIGCQNGRFRNEDAVTLYGYRVVDPDGQKGVIITNVIESSPQSQRSAVTFEEDYAYAIHRDGFLRDVHANGHYGVLGSCHMHPPMAHRFSATDLGNFSMYLENQKLYLAGLFHLEENELRLTMRVCARDPKNPCRLLLWDLPTAVSDDDVFSRLPPEGKKTNEQIWKEVAGCHTAPRFVIMNEAPRVGQTTVQSSAHGEPAPQQNEAPETGPKEQEGHSEAAAPGPAPETPCSGPVSITMPEGTPCDSISIDICGLQEGAEGALHCILKDGVLRLFYQPVHAKEGEEPMPDAMADEPPAPFQMEAAAAAEKEASETLPHAD